MPLFKLTEVLPKDCKLDTLLKACNSAHELHLHELNDGALSMICFVCPFHHVLTWEEETVVRKQMGEQEEASKLPPKPAEKN